jgi:hypothetical protein
MLKQFQKVSHKEGVQRGKGRQLTPCQGGLGKESLQV